MRPPVFTSLGGYKTSWLTTDVIAGLTVWAVLVPESLAYASIAGVSPVVGLYAAPAALIFYAAFGSSRHLIVGPMSATDDLAERGIRFLVARDVGELRDLLRADAAQQGTAPPPLYRTVRDALDALEAP